MKNISRPAFGSKDSSFGMKRDVSRLCSILMIFLFLHFSAVISFGLTVISPKGGEILASGSDWKIQWDNPEGATTFKVFYSVDNGATWNLISEDVIATEYSWNVPPPRGNKGKCLVKVNGYNSRGKKIASDRSDGLFKIEVLRLISPDGGEVLGTGDINSINWQVNKTVSEVSQIVLYYSLDDGTTWRVITNELSGSTSYFDWRVPRVRGVFRKARVKIVLKDLGGKIVGSDRCNRPFTITDGRRHFYDAWGGALSVDWVDPDDKVTTGDWASLGGTPYGETYYTYENCPSGKPVQGFWIKGKNLTSRIPGDVGAHYWATCGYFWCYCDEIWYAYFSLVMGYNILSISASNQWGASTTVLETIKRIPLAPTGVAVVPGNGQNTITWDDVPEATSYNIYWSETYPVTKAEANRIPRVLSPYVHSGLTNGKTYYYVVTAAAANVESDESETVLGVAGWNIFILDSVSATADYMESSIGLDAAGKVHVRYSYSEPVPPYARLIHQSYITNSGGSWTKSDMLQADSGDLAVGRDGTVHIIYPGFQGLTYGVKAPTGEWAYAVVNSSRPCISSLALDSNDQPHIAYFGGNNLLHTTKVNDSWPVETVDSLSSGTGCSGRGGSILAIDNKNNAHVVYSSGSPDYDLLHATNESGAWEIFTIDSSGDVTPEDVSASVDSSGRLHVVYISIIPGSYYELKYATNAFGPWTIISIPEGGHYPLYPDIAVDKDDRIHISFCDAGRHELKYSTNRSGLWQTISLDIMFAPWRRGTNTSITTDSMNSAHISYYDIEHNLKYATDKLTP